MEATATARGRDGDIPSLEELLAELDAASGEEEEEEGDPPKPPEPPAPKPAQAAAPGPDVGSVRFRPLRGSEEAAPPRSRQPAPAPAPPPAPAPAAPAAAARAPARQAAEQAKEQPLLQGQARLLEDIEVHLQRLGHLGAAEEVRNQLYAVQQLSKEGLEKECRQSGLPFDDNLERKEFVDAMRNIIVWQHLPASELERECRNRGLLAGHTSRARSIAGRRQELFEKLVLSLREDLGRRIWKLRGIPLERLEDLQAAEELSEVWKETEAKSTRDLLDWYKDLGFPVERSMDISELRRLCKATQLWMALPWAQLRLECIEREVSTDAKEDEEDGSETIEDAGDEHRQVLVFRLLQQERLDLWEKRGIPAHRLGLDASIHLVKQCEEWSAMGGAELRRTCSEWCLPDDAGAEKKELLELLRTMCIWNLLPTDELQNECRDRGIKFEKIEKAKDGKEAVEGSDSDSDGSGDFRSQLLQRLAVDRFGDFYVCRGIPVKHLDALSVVYIYQELGKHESMSLKDLTSTCWDSWLPVPNNATPKELRDILRWNLIWSAMTLSDLRGECRERGVPMPATPAGGAGKGEEATRQDLMHLLLFQRCRRHFVSLGVPVERLGSYEACQQVAWSWAQINNMPHKEKVKMYKDMGFPTAPKDPELSRRLRRVHFWDQLPLKELQKECREHNVNSIAKESQRKELLERLVAVLEEEPRHEEQPQQPHRQGAGSRSGGYPSGTSGGGKGSPWHRKGCAAQPPPGADFGGPFAGRFQQPDIGKGEAYFFARGGWGGAAPEPVVPEKIARHFALLQLPVTAGSEEVRKAYRKCALKYHPDKQQPGVKAASAEEFHKVKEAHEALTEWLRTKGR